MKFLFGAEKARNGGVAAMGGIVVMYVLDQYSFFHAMPAPVHLAVEGLVMAGLAGLVGIVVYYTDNKEGA